MAGKVGPLKLKHVLLYNNLYRQFHDRTCFTIECRKQWIGLDGWPSG